MRRKLSIDEVVETFILTNAALGVFSEYGMASGMAEVDMLRASAEYILTEDKDKFLKDTEFTFGFDKERIEKVLLEYAGDRKVFIL